MCSGDQRWPLSQSELLLHLGPECQTTATTSQGDFPGRPHRERGPVQGLETSETEPGGWLGSGLYCHGDLQLPEPLLRLETTFMGLGGV